MYNIEITNRAHRQIRKLNQPDQPRIFAAIRSLENFPGVPNVIKIVKSENYRLRAGSYRVIFQVAEESETITVLNVRRRNERTYS